MAIERSSLPDQVFRTLADAVLPGQRAMAAELGVNMASLREGIKRLEQLRLVEVRHGDAMRVTDWRAQGGLDVLVYAATADPEAVGALFEARRLLLREAARLAAERRTPAQAQLLDDLSRAFAEAADDETAQTVDLAFFATVIEAAGNLVFTLILNSIRALYLEQLERFRPIVVGRDDLIPHYAQAAAAIAEGRADDAAEAVERLAAVQEERMR
jgi:GntR family transcriptional repressor for pyruvate dehydrogenase complex